MHTVLMQALGLPSCPLCGHRSWTIEAAPQPLSTCLQCGVGYPARR